MCNIPLFLSLNCNSFLLPNISLWHNIRTMNKTLNPAHFVNIIIIANLIIPSSLWISPIHLAISSPLRSVSDRLLLVCTTSTWVVLVETCQSLTASASASPLISSSSPSIGFPSKAIFLPLQLDSPPWPSSSPFKLVNWLSSLFSNFIQIKSFMDLVISSNPI